MGRLERVGSAVANALLILPAADSPGHMSPGEFAAGLALILRARCGPMERLTLASAALMALDRDTAEALAKATLHDLHTARPTRRTAPETMKPEGIIEMTTNESKAAECAVCNPDGHPPKSYDEMFAERREIVEPDFILASDGPKTYAVIDLRTRYREDGSNPIPEIAFTKLEIEAARIAQDHAIACEAEPAGRGFSIPDDEAKGQAEHEFSIKGRIVRALHGHEIEGVERVAEDIYAANPWHEPEPLPDDGLPF